MQTTYDAAAKLIGEFPWLKNYERDLESLILEESDHWSAEQGKSKPYSDAVERAYGLMQMWIEQADEYRINLDDFDDVLVFIAGRRRACAWTILLAKHQMRK